MKVAKLRHDLYDLLLWLLNFFLFFILSLWFYSIVKRDLLLYLFRDRNVIIRRLIRFLVMINSLRNIVVKVAELS